MTHPSSSAEQVSALADGRLQGAELAQALVACEQDEALLECWRDYHLIGDVLRGVPPLAEADEASFLARLRPALQAQAEPSRIATPAPVLHLRSEAANEPWFRWRWVAGLASLALVAGVSWTLLGEDSDEGAFALGESPVLVSGPQGVVVRDAALEELMEAHRQQGGASVLPMPSGFLRNATFEAAPAAVTRSGRAQER